MTLHTGRHFLQIPGPSAVPDRVLRAMDMPTIDHRGPEFAELGREVIEGCQTVFKTKSPVIIYPSSGTGAWESALVNTLSAGRQGADVRDRPLRDAVARRWPTSWALRSISSLATGAAAPDPEAIEERLAADRDHAIKAVAVVHNETSTGVASRIADIRKAMDRAKHPALFLVDTISSLGSIDYRHDEWGVDVTVSCSQKGLMLPPGLGFTAVSEKALAASKTNTLPRSYWDWHDMLGPNQDGFSRTRPPRTCCTG